MRDSPATRAPDTADGARALPWLMALLVLLLDPGAALGSGAYFFRDISLDYLPTRVFVGRELAAGRLPFWIPQLYEGTFLLPPLYPPDLLHALSQRPAFISWLLTLHLPLAALAAYALARELGLGRPGAALAGAAYALGGFSLSTLNLHRFLHALAWAPLMIAGLRRAARLGGAAVPTAAAAVAVSLSTLTFEFTLPALALALALALETAPTRAGLARLTVALATGLALAGLPLLVGFGMLGESVRAEAGVAPGSLSYSVHPFALLQALLAGLFGPLDSTGSVWWGAAFFTGGYPYFQSLYLGPVLLALAWAGWRGLPGRAALIVAAAGLVGLLWSLGPDGGLAPWLAGLPVVRSFRYPCKLYLLPHLATAVLAGAGLERLRHGTAWRWLVAPLLGLLLSFAALLALLGRDVELVGGLFLLLPRDAQRASQALGAEALTALLLTGLALLVALAAGRGHLRPRLAAGLLGALAAADLWRAGAGLNPRVTEDFYQLHPALAAERLSALPGEARVYSVPALESRTFRSWLRSGATGVGAPAFFVNRQLLDPFNNLLDGVDSAQSSDRTGLIPQATTLEDRERAVARLDAALPKLRDSAVARVLSLDALEHPALRPRALAPLGASGLAVHVYELADTAPRAHVACRVLPAASRAEALAGALAPGFAPDHDVLLEQPFSAECRSGSVRPLERWPGHERDEVELDGAGLLVLRESHARGWRAHVDGRDAPVLRANGRHRAVPLSGGRHEVTLDYHPPMLEAGLGLSGLGLLGLLTLTARALRRPAPGRA